MSSQNLAIAESMPSGNPPQLKKDLAIVIMAAGKGTRMKSQTPKVIHKVAGRPMIEHILRAAEGLEPKKIIVVLSPAMNVGDITKIIAPHSIVIQQEQKGTGDALHTACPLLADFKGDVMVLNGDMPLVTTDTLRAFHDYHATGDFGATILAMAVPNPTGYGRVFQNADGTLRRIVEEKDASEDERAIRLCYSGLMIVNGDGLSDALAKIQNNNAQGEYYLVDLPVILAADGIATGVTRGDYQELRGVNSRVQLAEIEIAWQGRKRLEMMDAGITLTDPHTVYFSADTKIAPDVTIGPSVVFGENVTIESHAEIRAFCHIEGVHIKSGAVIGPFARIRPDSVIGENAKVGNFVEVKNSVIGNGAKANHLGYIGDAELGHHSNFGCGAITVNYDGRIKSKTKIGQHVMIGSNASLIAPITIEDGAYVAAGSTLTQTVPSDALAVGRAKQVNMPGRAKGRMKKD